MLLGLLVGSLLVCLVVADPSKYANELKPKESSCESVASFYSYHIHVLFWSKNNDSVNAAKVLQQKFRKQFGVLVDPCPESVWNTTHSPDILCFFPWAPEADGPFLTGMWAAFVPLERFKDTVPWMMQHRGNLDVFVHPNSGCEIYDHVNWPLWGGKPWEIDVSAFHYNCPDCDQGTCTTSAANLMFFGESYQCGLATGTTDSSPFVLRDAEAFCTSPCQQWVSNLHKLSKDCPFVCDNFAPRTQSHDICMRHYNSYAELHKWRIGVCHIPS